MAALYGQMAFLSDPHIESTFAGWFTAYSGSQRKNPNIAGCSLILFDLLSSLTWYWPSSPILGFSLPEQQDEFSDATSKPPTYCPGLEKNVIIAFKIRALLFLFGGHPTEAQGNPEGNLMSDFFSSQVRCFYCNVLWLSIFPFYYLGIWESALAREFKATQFPPSFKVKPWHWVVLALRVHMGLIKVIFLSTEPEISDSCCKCVINLLHKFRLIHTLYSVLKQHKKIPLIGMQRTFWTFVSKGTPFWLFYFFVRIPSVFTIVHLIVPLLLQKVIYLPLFFFFFRFIYLGHLTIFCV